jgi:hypothetical protein
MCIGPDSVGILIIFDTAALFKIKYFSVMEKHLILVYNADAGLLNMAADWLHKIISPSTYACSLCALTYGHLGEKKEWRNLLSTLNCKTDFLHKDEFYNQYPNEKFDLPCVLINENGSLSVLLSADELNAMKSLDELKVAVLDLDCS